MQRLDYAGRRVTSRTALPGIRVRGPRQSRSIPEPARLAPRPDAVRGPECGRVPTRLNRRIPESRLTRPGRESESDSDAMARRSEEPPKPLSGTASLRLRGVRAGKAASEAAGGRRETRRETRLCRSASRSARRRTGGAARHPREREWASRLRICSSTKDRRNSHGNFALNSSTVPCVLSVPIFENNPQRRKCRVDSCI